MIPSQNENKFHQDVLEQTRRALAETQALYQVARSLITFQNLSALFETVVDTIAEALPANRVTLITFDSKTQNVTNFVKGGAGAKYVVEVSFEELWDGLSGWTLRELKPALSPKDLPDPRESLEVRRRRLETNCGSIIVVPLYHHSHVLGTMTAINGPDEREFTEHDVELMMAMASQCAIAIENARLFTQLQSTNSDLEQRVSERTSKLAETNVRLQTEIAEHSRVANALRASEARYRVLVETMNDGLSVVDENIVLTYVNRRFCDLLAYTQDEMVGRPLTSFLDAANQEIFNKHLARRRKGEQSLYEINWTTKNGNKIDTIVSGTPLLGDQGEFRGSFAVITDITERKQMEKALRESETRYRSIVTAMPEGIIVQDSNGAIETWNAAAETILGLTRNQMVENVCVDPDWRIIHEDGSPFSDETHPMNVTLQTGRPQRNVIMGIQKPDGVLTWISINSEPLTHPSEMRPYAVVTSFADITVNKRSEAALRQSEEHARGFQEKLKALQEISLELAAVGSLEQLCQRAIELGLSSLGYDRIGLLLFENADRTKISLFGLESSGELRIEHGVSYKPAADPVYSHLHNREDAFVREDVDLRDFDKVVGRGWNVVVGIWDANARIGWLAADNLFNQQPLLPYQIELLKLYGLTLGHLVTRKQAEEALRASEAHLRAVVSGTPVILFELDLNGVLTFLQGRGVHMFEGGSRIFVGNSIFDSLGEVVPDIRERFQMALAGEETNSIQTWGDVILDIRYSPLRNTLGEVSGIIGVATDITERLNAEKLRIELEKEQEVIALKERFIATASHDFRTPLTIIKMIVNMLEIYLDRMAPQQRTAKLLQIGAQVDYMVQLINDVLTMSKANAGKLDFKPVRIALRPFCVQIWENFQSMAEKTHTIELIYDVDYDEVELDPNLVHYILVNLLSNAIKYSPQKGHICFKVKYDKDNLIFQVADNGIGIPDADQPKLFQPFHRAANTLDIEGTGLGLSIVKSYIETHGGTITVQSKENEGTIITVKLPFHL